MISKLVSNLKNPLSISISGLPTPVLPPKEIGGTLHSEPNATNSFLSLKTPSWLKKGQSDESEKAIVSHLGIERDIDQYYSLGDNYIP